MGCRPAASLNEGPRPGGGGARDADRQLAQITSATARRTSPQLCYLDLQISDRALQHSDLRLTSSDLVLQPVTLRRPLSLRTSSSSLRCRRGSVRRGDLGPLSKILLSQAAVLVEQLVHLAVDVLRPFLGGMRQRVSGIGTCLLTVALGLVKHDPARSDRAEAATEQETDPRCEIDTGGRADSSNDGNNNGRSHVRLDQGWGMGWTSMTG